MSDETTTEITEDEAVKDEAATEDTQAEDTEAPVEDTPAEEAEAPVESEEPTAEVVSMAEAKEAKEAEKPPMELTPNEMMALQRLRAQTQQILTQIGQLEVQKAAALARINMMENEAQQMLTLAGKRLGIPEGVQWQAAPDGKVSLMPQMPPQMHHQPGQ